MSVTTVEAVVSPDPEVRPARQVYPAAYKLRVLAELDAADSKSERGEILRREGLYSSLVSEWRKQRERGALEAMRQKHPGRKGDPIRAENTRLRAQVEDLEGRLQVTERLIYAQGKVSALLQMPSLERG
jgi:transposase-like protein